MGTITCQAIVDRAWIKVNDTNSGTGVRWPSTEAFYWICDGQREIVNQLPKAYTKTATPNLVAGSRQTLAGLSLADGISIIDVPRVVGGRALTKIDRIRLDEQRPSWHTEAGSPMHWVYDPADPKAFYVFPNSTVAVEVVYAATPPDPANIAAAITLDDIYANALQWFVLHSFYSKDANYTKSPQNAASYWAQFMQSLGLRDRNVMMQGAALDAKAAGQ